MFSLCRTHTHTYLSCSLTHTYTHTHTHIWLSAEQTVIPGIFERPLLSACRDGCTARGPCALRLMAQCCLSSGKRPLAKPALKCGHHEQHGQQPRAFHFADRSSSQTNVAEVARDASKLCCMLSDTSRVALVIFQIRSRCYAVHVPAISLTVTQRTL